MSNNLLKLEEVAYRLGISYNQARMLVLYEEKIPIMKVGSRGVRVREEELEKYLQSLQKEEGTGGSQKAPAGEPYQGRKLLPADSPRSEPPPKEGS